MPKLTTFEKNKRAAERKKRADRIKKNKQKDERRFLKQERTKLVKQPQLNVRSRRSMDEAIKAANELRAANESDNSIKGLIKAFFIRK